MHMLCSIHHDNRGMKKKCAVAHTAINCLNLQILVDFVTTLVKEEKLTFSLLNIIQVYVNYTSNNLHHFSICAESWVDGQRVVEGGVPNFTLCVCNVLQSAGRHQWSVTGDIEGREF